jgi:uncharacterized membrane-anchored protein YhcB (DUF1043 family)
MQNEFWHLLFFAAGTLAGWIITWMILRFKTQALTLLTHQQSNEIMQLSATAQQLTSDKNVFENDFVRYSALYQQSVQMADQLNSQLNERIFQLNKANEEKATFYAQLRNAREKLDNQQNDILRLREQFRLEFSELAQKILERASD